MQYVFQYSYLIAYKNIASYDNDVNNYKSRSVKWADIW